MINKPDYTNSIANLANSILKRFNVEPFHPTIKSVDEILKNKKKILVFLFDGMGEYIIRKHLKEDSFFRTHILTNITSTMPPTTVAATNSFLSGLYPEENGWLGWSQYFKENDKIIDVFNNYIEGEDRYLEGENYMSLFASYHNLADLINNTNKKDTAKLIFSYPVDKNNKNKKRMKSFVKYAYQEANRSDETFTYAYNVSPDCYMHIDGTSSRRIHRKIKQIEKWVKKYSLKNKDVLTLIIADHGMKDVYFDQINSYPDLLDTLLRPTTLECRCANFYVKKDRKSEFEALFNKYYGKHYKLFTVKEAIEEHLFGEGKPSELALSFLGDYIAISMDEVSLEYLYPNEKEGRQFKGHHAGGTLEELLISVVALNDD